MSVLDAEFDSLALGDRFTTRARTVTEADVVHFGCLTGDMHPQHTDAAWASTSVFGERVAHGMLVASFAFGLVPFDPDRVIALRRVRDAVFKRPVALGDTIHVAGRIDRVDEVDEATGIVGVRLDVINQRELTVARLAAEVLWRRDGTALPKTARAEELFELAGLPI